MTPCNRPNTKWFNKKTKDLFKAFLMLKNVDEVARFCRDLMTEDEIEELSNRWLVAKLLNKGLSQRTIASKTGVSLATVSRVNYWLKKGMKGYKLLLERLRQTKAKGATDKH